MARGQITGIHISLISFLGSLAIYYTTLEFATYLEEALGVTKYHHQDSGITNSGLMSVLLNHRSRTTHERNPSIFYNNSREFSHKLHYFRVGHLPRRGNRKHKVSSPGPWHSKPNIHVSPIGSLIKDK
jgi:hypothetical protein